MSTSFMASKVVICLACLITCVAGVQTGLAQVKWELPEKFTPEQYAEFQEKAAAILKGKPIAIDPKEDELQRLLKERFNSATKEVDVQFLLFENDLATFDSVCESVRRWSKAGLELAPEPAEQVKILEMQLVVTKFLEADCAAKFKGKSEDLANALQAKNLRLTAEVDLLRLKKSLQVSKGE
jgi:hypothetical protein